MDRFTTQFHDALCLEELSQLAFPDAFDGGLVVPERAVQVAAAEWKSWKDGGYAVCLRSFTGSTCVQKESIGQSLKRQRSDDNSDLADAELLDLIERLDSLLLPFAPYQRPAGTPGLTIDRLLGILALGASEPYPETAIR